MQSNKVTLSLSLIALSLNIHFVTALFAQEYEVENSTDRSASQQVESIFTLCDDNDAEQEQEASGSTLSCKDGETGWGGGHTCSNDCPPACPYCFKWVRKIPFTNTIINQTCFCWDKAELK